MACNNQIEKDKLVAPMRLIIGFQEVAQFIRANRSTPCRMNCAVCRDPWGRSGTVNVNLLFVKNNTLYVCDNCTKIDELSEVEVAQFKQE